ncbi:DMT family transporter [Microbacterium jejuense]|nr:DMT family transporter [Microbacterium jejuense]
MTERRLPAWMGLGAAAVIGVLTAIQARINGQLGTRLGDGFTAAVISFGSGLVVLIVLSLVIPQGRRGFAALVAGLRRREPDGRRGIPFWMLCGGIAGALSVATQSLAVGIIGVALFTVGVVAGQTVSGLLLDRSGIGPAGVVAVTPARLVGGALAMLAAAVSLAGGVHAPPVLIVLPFLVGAGIAWQSAVNGRLRQRVGTPLTATLVNFIGGTVVLGVAELVHSFTVAPPPTEYPAEPWLYIGGVIGVTYIFLAAALVPYTGVLLLGLGTVVGQVVTSVVIDALWPTAAAPALWQSLLMSSLAILSVVVAAVPWRWTRGGR